MKKIFYILISIIVALTVSCDPQLDNAPDIGGQPTIDFMVDDSNPNTLILEANSDNGFMYNWDLGNGESTEGKVVSAYFPFSGDYTVTCIVSGKGGENTISKIITIASTDPDILEKPGFKELTNSGVGRIWSYQGDSGYFFMTADYDWTEFWWDPYEDYPSPDYYSKMKFDLNGGYNYTFVDENGNETKGNFLLDMDQMTLTIIDARFPDEDDDNMDTDAITGTYNLKVLDDGTLHVWVEMPGWEVGWSWIFNSEN